MILVGAAVASLVVVFALFRLIAELHWTRQEVPADSLFGINFSCDQAEYLLLETADGPYASDDRAGRAQWCGEVLGRILDATGAKYVRLSLVWDEVEPSEDEYDFSTPDELLRVAGEHGAAVALSIGMKAQRHPEFYIPEWVLQDRRIEAGEVISDDPVVRARALAMVAVATRHFAESDVIDAWLAENEPYIASRRVDHVSLSYEYTAEVAGTIRANDPMGRTVVINHAQHEVTDQRWRRALADGDTLGQSLYPRRNAFIFGVKGAVNIMELGLLTPNYAYQAKEAANAGKEFWITELQGEPWTDTDSRLITPTNPSANLNPSTFEENILYGRKSGADRIYLWGAEWWLYQAEHFGDAAWLEAARGAVGE